MKRIAIDAHILTGMFQGSRTYLENILAWIGRLDRRNRYLIFSFDPGHSRALLDFPNFEHIRIPVEAAVPRLLFYWPYAKLRYRFDALVTQYILPPLVPGRQFVVIHDILPETHPDLFPRAMRLRSQVMFRLSAHLAHELFAVSSFTRDEIVRRYGVPAERIHLTYNGFDRAAFEAAAESSSDAARPDGGFILYVGRLEPRKNVHLILDALPLMTRAPRLVVVGRHSFGSEQLVNRLAAHSRVTHLQDVSAAELDTLYRAAGVFVYPSRAEGFGLPLLEALARGIPVVSSNQTSLPEVGGTLATYFDPTTPQAARELAGALDEAFTNRRCFDRRILAAHLAKFDWEKSAQTIVARIDAML